MKANAEIAKAETLKADLHPSDFAVRLRRATPEQIRLIEKILAGEFPAAVMVMKADGFLDRKELTEHLKISIRCLEEWQRRGVLPYIKIGRIILFHWPDVVEHLRRHYRVPRQPLRGVEG